MNYGQFVKSTRIKPTIMYVSESWVLFLGTRNSCLDFDYLQYSAFGCGLFNLRLTRCQHYNADSFSDKPDFNSNSVLCCIAF